MTGRTIKKRARPLRAMAALACALSATAAHPQATPPSPTVAEVFADLPVVGTDISHTQPSAEDEQPRLIGSGMASYYARAFDGRRTASGERFSSAALTAAHRTLPFGTRLRVTNPANGKSIVVKVNDRGPFKRDRVLDVSEAAARQLGLIARGSGMVELAVIDPA